MGGGAPLALSVVSATLATGLPASTARHRGSCQACWPPERATGRKSPPRAGTSRELLDVRSPSEPWVVPDGMGSVDPSPCWVHKAEGKAVGTGQLLRETSTAPAPSTNLGPAGSAAASPTAPSPLGGPPHRLQCPPGLGAWSSRPGLEGLSAARRSARRRRRVGRPRREASSPRGAAGVAASSSAPARKGAPRPRGARDGKAVRPARRVLGRHPQIPPRAPAPRFPQAALSPQLFSLPSRRHFRLTWRVWF